MSKQFPNAVDRDATAPAGYKRTDQRLRRKDQLEQQAEEQAAESGIEAINPDALLPDDELQQLLEGFDGSQITNADPNYVYMWVCVEFPASARGLAVLTHTSQGWEVVKGDSLEAVEYRQPDGTRKLGDSILLRITRRRKAALDYRVAALNAKREGQSQEELQAIAARYGIQVVPFDQMSPERQAFIERRAQAAFSQQAAMQKFAENARTGTIPGVPPGR